MVNDMEQNGEDKQCIHYYSFQKTQELLRINDGDKLKVLVDLGDIAAAKHGDQMKFKDTEVRRYQRDVLKFVGEDLAKLVVEEVVPVTQKQLGYELLGYESVLDRIGLDAHRMYELLEESGLEYKRVANPEIGEEVNQMRFIGEFYKQLNKEVSFTSLAENAFAHYETSGPYDLHIGLIHGVLEDSHEMKPGLLEAMVPKQRNNYNEHRLCLGALESVLYRKEVKE